MRSRRRRRSETAHVAPLWFNAHARPRHLLSERVQPRQQQIRTSTCSTLHPACPGRFPPMAMSVTARCPEHVTAHQRTVHRSYWIPRVVCHSACRRHPVSRCLGPSCSKAVRQS